MTFIRALIAALIDSLARDIEWETNHGKRDM